MPKSFEVTFDVSDFKEGIGRLNSQISGMVGRGLEMVGDELLRLSSFEVPHDLGTLQASGNVDKRSDLEVEVGYHTKYAARLHEHPEYHFQKGRKGKYLEDPLKENLTKWGEILTNWLRKELAGVS